VVVEVTGTAVNELCEDLKGQDRTCVSHGISRCMLPENLEHVM
jgi:hypothetical protein